MRAAIFNLGILLPRGLVSFRLVFLLTEKSDAFLFLRVNKNTTPVDILIF